MSDRKVMHRALVSVYDKTRLLEIGTVLSDAGIEILSTGSTAAQLAKAGIAVTEVSTYTGFPEIMGGRVKTLHPRVHSGILADQNNPQHMAAIADLDIAPFDLVIINLYPFAATIASGADFAECIEQIDIGGPSMLRGGAKNHGSVAVISSPSQYDGLIAAIKEGGFTPVPIIYHFSHSDSTVSIRCEKPLKYFTKYTLTVPTTLASKSGGHIAKYYAAQLRTGLDTSIKFSVISDNQLMDSVQYRNLQYFWNFAHPISGLARERNTSGDLVTEMPGRDMDTGPETPQENMMEQPQ